MATTVQLNPSTKEELLIIKARLEQQTGKKHTLDDAIRWLLDKAQSLSLEERMKDAGKSFGAVKDLGITSEDLKQLRKQRMSRVATF